MFLEISHLSTLRSWEKNKLTQNKRKGARGKGRRGEEVYIERHWYNSVLKEGLANHTWWLEAKMALGNCPDLGPVKTFMSHNDQADARCEWCMTLCKQLYSGMRLGLTLEVISQRNFQQLGKECRGGFSTGLHTLKKKWIKKPPILYHQHQKYIRDVWRLLQQPEIKREDLWVSLCQWT